MPFLTLVPRSACDLCGCRLRGFTMGTYRVNKNSLRSERGGLSWLECPECGPTHARSNPLPTRRSCDTWRLDDPSQALVDQARERRGWQVTRPAATGADQ
jgi:hypothetical protein